jgi:hypothetical protein
MIKEYNKIFIKWMLLSLTILTFKDLFLSIYTFKYYFELFFFDRISHK